MKFLKKYEKMLTDSFFSYYLFIAGLLAVLTTPNRLTDYTHEIELIGSAWFRGGSIPLVQAYSGFSPLMLYVGAQYDRFVSTNTLRWIFEGAAYCTLAYLFYRVTRHQFAKFVALQNTVLLFGLLVLLVPGVWQLGISPTKLGIIFLLGLIHTYNLWESSGKSYWLFGKTTKNWRFLLASGVLLTLLVSTSPLLGIFAIPVLIRYARYSLNSSIFINTIAFLAVPMFALTWVWYSYFSSRGLLVESLRAMSVNFKMLVGLPNNIGDNAIIVVPFVILLVMAIPGANSKNLKTSHSAWIASLGALGGILLSVRSSAVLLLPFVATTAVPTFKQRIKPSLIAIFCVIGIILAVPYRYMDSKKSQLRSAQSEVATSYVQQRLQDTSYVYYYGRGGGFYINSGLEGSTRFYDASVFEYDTAQNGLVDKFRGDNEANAPQFVVYATYERGSVATTPRIEEYFTKHYDEVAKLDGYKILRRK